MICMGDDTPWMLLGAHPAGATSGVPSVHRGAPMYAAAMAEDRILRR